MRLAPPVSSRATRAKYSPEAAAAGTAHEADTAQLPASTSPVEGSVSGLGWTCRRVCEDGIVVTSLAPAPP